MDFGAQAKKKRDGERNPRSGTLSCMVYIQQDPLISHQQFLPTSISSPGSAQGGHSGEGWQRGECTDTRTLCQGGTRSPTAPGAP